MPISRKEGWLQNTKRFLELWNLPNCFGVKHIRLKIQKRTGSSYFNYKEYFSINLMTCSHHNQYHEY